MDLSILVPILTAFAGGVGALFLLGPRKNSIIAEASQHAVEVVEKALERMEDEMVSCHEQIARLEGELGREMAGRHALELQVDVLSAEVRRLGGDPLHVLKGSF